MKKINKKFSRERKNNSLRFFVFFSFLLTFVFVFTFEFQFSLADQTNQNEDDQFEPLNAITEDLTIDTPAENVSEKQAGIQDDERTKSLLPLYTLPFNKFDFSFQPDGKQSYNPGEVLFLKGNLSFSDKDREEEIQQIIKLCSENEEKKENCQMTNEYNFPYFKNANVLVKIWREDESEERMKNGDYLIDEFYIPEEINIEKDKLSNFQIEWKIPQEIKGGQFYGALFLNTNKRFGLVDFPVNTFSPLVRFDFNISNDSEKKGLEINKNKVKINEQDYSQVLPVPLMEKNENGINISFPIANNNPSLEKAKIKYQLYRWTQEDPADMLESKEEEKEINSGEEINLNYNFKPNEIDSFYTLKIIVSSPNSQSNLNVHMVIQEKNRGLFIYLGLANNSTDSSQVPFFCMRNAQWIGLFEGKIKITILNKEGKEIKKWEKNAIMDNEDRCFAVKYLEIPNSSDDLIKDNLIVKGQIFNNSNEIVDEKIINSNFLSTLKEKEEKEQEKKVLEINPSLVSPLTIFLLTILFLMAILSFTFIIIKRKKDDSLEKNL